MKKVFLAIVWVLAFGHVIGSAVMAGNLMKQGRGGGHTSSKETTISGFAVGDGFGSSVAVSGDRNTMVVGAPGQEKAYAFARLSTGWVLQGTLSAGSDVYSSDFGRSVAISRDGNTIVVGAPLTQGIYDYAPGRGAAFVYRRVDIEWVLTDTLWADAGVPFDMFGFSVAVSAHGETVVIGAKGNNNDWVAGSSTFLGAGAVYVFRNPQDLYGGWDFDAKLTADDRALGDWFGSSVAISDYGNTILIGAPGTGTWGSTASNKKGAVYVFTGLFSDSAPSAWTQQAKLTPSGYEAQDGDEFGHSVALSADGNTALIGAWYMFPQSGGQGGAYVFNRVNSAWSQSQLLSDSKGAIGDVFGSSVAIAGNKAVIGAMYRNGFQGGAYMFNYRNTWSQGSEFGPSNSASSGFGASVGLSADGNTLIIGAPGSQSLVYIYDFATPGITINPDVLPDGKVGEIYSESFSVTGASGNHAYVYSWVGGRFPDGLLFYTTGAVAGIPTKAGKYSFSIAVEDVYSGFTATKSYTISVSQ